MNIKILQVVLAAWAGSLWTICLLVAPSLFAVSPDRQLAGQLAGHFFRVESWLGIVFGGIALFLLTRGAVPPKNATTYSLVTVTVAGPVANEVILRPLMDAARAVNDMKLFGLLHGVGALLFGLACFTALILLWRVAGQRKD